MLNRIVTYLLVAGGGALGSVLRFACSNALGHYFGENVALGTLVVNVTGSFAIGLFATLTLPSGHFPLSQDARIFFMTGICGGYTTFSAFSLQTVNLALQKEWLAAGLNVVLSVALCLAAAWLGHLLAVSLSARH